MIGICIFKETTKREKHRGGGQEKRDKGKPWWWTMRLYTQQRTARSLRVSLWAKLHLLIEMREQKEKIQVGEKRKRDRVQWGEWSHTHSLRDLGIKGRNWECSSFTAAVILKRTKSCYVILPQSNRESQGLYGNDWKRTNSYMKKIDFVCAKGNKVHLAQCRGL